MGEDRQALAENAQTPFRPRFGRVLRRALNDFYDQLVLVAAATFLWGLAIGLPAACLAALLRGRWGWLAAGCAALVASAAANAALFHLAHLVATREPASLGALGRGLREFFWRSLGLAALLGVAGGAAVANAAFYLQVLRGNRLAAVIGLICAYLLGLLYLAALYAYPLLVVRRQKPLAALRNSALLALDNAGFTLLFGSFWLGLTVLVGLPAATAMPYLVGLSALIGLFVYAGFFALLANHALLELLRKYEVSGGSAI